MYMVYRPSTGMVNDELILFFLVFERNGFEEEEGLMMKEGDDIEAKRVYRNVHGQDLQGLGGKRVGLEVYRISLTTNCGLTADI